MVLATHFKSTFLVLELPATIQLKVIAFNLSFRSFLREAFTLFCNKRLRKHESLNCNWMVAGNSKTRNVDLKCVSNNAKTIHSRKSDPNPHSSLMCTICGTTRNEFANHDNQHNIVGAGALEREILLLSMEL